MVSIDSQIIFNLFSMLMKISQEKQNSDKLIASSWKTISFSEDKGNSISVLINHLYESFPTKTYNL